MIRRTLTVAAAVLLTASCSSTNADTRRNADLCVKQNSGAACINEIITTLETTILDATAGAPVTHGIFEDATHRVINDRRLAPDFHYERSTPPENVSRGNTDPITFTLTISGKNVEYAKSTHLACLGSNFKIVPVSLGC